MCINIWQKFHLLHLFSIGLMHEASVLKTFEWKLQKRAEREKGCRKGWAVGRTAGKAENWSLARAGGFGSEAGGQPTKRPAWLHTQYGLFTPNPPGQAPPSPAHPPSSFSSLTFLSSHLRKQMGLRERVVRVGNRRGKLSWFFSPTSSPSRREPILLVPRLPDPEQGFSSASLQLFSAAAASLVTPYQWPVMSLKECSGF